MAASAVRMAELGMSPALAKEIATQIDAGHAPGTITNDDVATDAAIVTSKLADATELAALVAEETELTALAGSDLVTAVGTPAAYSEVAADIAAALVAAGLMEAEA